MTDTTSPAVAAVADAALDIGFRIFPASGASAPGDFFVIDHRDDGSTMVVVADVCGHGDQAARVAADVRPVVEDHARAAADPGRLLESVNDALGARMEHRGFLSTAIAAHFVPHGRRFSWASAGHPPPYWLDGAQAVNGATPGPPIGVAERVRCVASPWHDIAPGTGVLLYTDGLPEARAPRGERFGMVTIGALLAELASLPSQETVDALTGHLVDFGEGTVSDDVCLVAVRVP